MLSFDNNALRYYLYSVKPQTPVANYNKVALYSTQ